MQNLTKKPAKIVMDKEDKAVIAKLITEGASEDKVVSTLKQLRYDIEEIRKIYQTIYAHDDQMNKIKALEENFNKN
jgi:formaldehyde-activating enzyme involved in methanogenesis